MLYEIDESCMNALETKDLNIIAFFEQLALDRRKCKNIVVAKREIFYKLASTELLSEISRSVYNVLGNRMSERKLLLKQTPKYCRIVAGEKGKSIAHDDSHDIILLNIQEGAVKDFTSSPFMLAENEEDIEFYKLVGKYYAKTSGLGNLNINFENRNGGGSTISAVLQHIISEKNRMCLCIVDSDRKYEKDTSGDTMNKVKNVCQGVVQDYFEVLLLEAHEIENIIPFGVLEKVITEKALEKQGLEFLKYLLQCDNTVNSPIFCFDLKKGILKSSFILENETNDEKKRQYRKKELYRKYWKKYIEGYGITIDENSDEILVKGICERILRYALKYLSELDTVDKLFLIELEKPIQQIWNIIGEKVYCWGCMGGRIAV